MPGALGRMVEEGRVGTAALPSRLNAHLKLSIATDALAMIGSDGPSIRPAAITVTSGGRGTARGRPSTIGREIPRGCHFSPRPP